MSDIDKTKTELLAELRVLRERVARLEREAGGAMPAGTHSHLLGETLAEVTLALASQTSSEAVLDEIILQVQRVVPSTSSNIALVEDGTLRTVRWRGYEVFGAEEMISNLVQPLDMSPIDFEAIATREPVVVHDSHSALRWVVIEETAWIRSYVVVPICLHDRALGLLRLDSEYVGSFSEEEARLLLPFANAAAVALEQARLYEGLQHELDEHERAGRLLEESRVRLRRRNRELELLNRVGQAFISILNLDQVLGAILEEVRHLLSVLATSIWLIDEETGELVCRQATGPQADIVRGWRLSPGQGIAGWAASRGESLIVHDAQSDHRHFTRVGKRIGVSFRSLICVPLQTREGVIGVLQVLDPQKHQFGEDDLLLVESLAATAAIAIDNARLFEQVRRDAETKATLLEVVNHRVKNNLAAIIGLLYVQRDQTWIDSQPAYQAAMDELVGRVRGLAIVHQMLSASEWKPLLVRDIILRVASSSLQLLMGDKHVALRVAPSSLKVTSTQAHNLALVVNELVVSMVRNSIGNRDESLLEIDIDRLDAMAEITFRVDGSGSLEFVVTEPSRDAGLELAKNIVRQTLRGELVLRNDRGVAAIVRFPAQG